MWLLIKKQIKNDFFNVNVYNNSCGIANISKEKQMEKILKGKLSINTSTGSKEELAEAIRDFLKGQTIHIVYVSINEIKVRNKPCEELYREIKNIHLDNIEMYKINPEKRNLWDLVHNIIKQTNSEGTFADLWNKNLLK